MATHTGLDSPRTGAKLMPTYTVRVYNTDPLGILSGTVGGFGTWSGEASPSGTATITDNDFAGVTITQSGTTDVGEDGTTDTYDITLN